MKIIHVKKSRNIKIKGEASKEIVELPLPRQVAIQPQDFSGLKLRLSVKEGDEVKVGSPLLTDKIHSELKIVSSACGRVASIHRGAKRALLEVVIESNRSQDSENFQKYSENQIKDLSRDETIKALLNGGMWPALRQRPFSHVADPTITPKSIFVHAMNTEPLAIDNDTVLEGRDKEFQVGLNVINKLTEGEVYVCVAHDSRSIALTSSKNVKIRHFQGAHPTGNVSTHIHYLDPILKGDHVWYLEAQDVLRIAHLFLEGTYSTERVVAVTGELASKRVYAKTVVGAPISLLTQGSNLEGARCISGSVLAGKNVGPKGYVGFYDSQISIIPEGGKRKFLGWLTPGFNSYTFSKTFASSFLPEGEASLDADKNGSDRAIVLNNIYDRYNTLDVITYFLLKAIIAGDIEEAEKLGILECDEEDFALATFACPSKTEVGKYIRAGLETIEREG